METTKMKIEYRKHVDSETAPWQLLTNMDELLWNGVYALRVAHDDGSHNLPFRFENDETVTIVVKDHAHEGMLENGRTVVQTITRVERTTGNVYVYTRTRYNAGGTHAWSYWTLAGEGSTALEIPTASKSSLGAVIVGDGLAVDADGKLSLAAGSVGKKQLATGVVAKIDSMDNALKHAGAFAVNDGVALYFGALVENSTPYSGTAYSVYTDRILANGERLIVNDGYFILRYKVFDGEQEVAFVDNLRSSDFLLEVSGRSYQFEFTKSDTTAFTNRELPVVIKYFQRNSIAWSAGSHINNYIAPGTYNIKGDRTNLADGLPIYNTGSFSARLMVLASNSCVTQLLTLLNVGGGDGNVYARTCRHGAWGTWGKLQQNVEVGAIGFGQRKTFDHLTDNGMYSGHNVYRTGTDDNGNSIIAYETFVLVVINGYFTGGGISQLKYSLLQNGITTVATREKTGEAWSEWSDVADVKNGAVTAEKLSADVREKVENPLRQLFIAAGAEYNDSGADKSKTAPWGETVTHKAGHYYLNGLGDITEEQMMDIYNAPHDGRTSFAYARNDARTFIVRGGTQQVGITSLVAWFGQAYNMEALGLVNFLGVASGSCERMFSGCVNLRHLHLDGVSFLYASNFNDAFTGCSSLITCFIKKVAKNIAFADSTKISKESIIYIVENSAPTSAITITLHPDAYIRLANDTEIVAALEAQPLVTLVSA